MALCVGCQFSSFDELEVAVKRYQEQTGTQLYKRDSRTVEAASKRNTRKNYKEEIRYSEINYFCVHGGKLYRHDYNEEETSKHRCPVKVKVRATKDGQKLAVKELVETHNHDLNEPVRRHHIYSRWSYNRLLTSPTSGSCVGFSLIALSGKTSQLLNQSSDKHVYKEKAHQDERSKNGLPDVDEHVNVLPRALDADSHDSFDGKSVMSLTHKNFPIMLCTEEKTLQNVSEDMGCAIQKKKNAWNLLKQEEKTAEKVQCFEYMTQTMSSSIEIKCSDAIKLKIRNLLPHDQPRLKEQSELKQHDNRQKKNGKKAMIKRIQQMGRLQKQRDGTGKFYQLTFDLNVYDSWRQIGTSQGLASDSQIAKFLIQHFHSSWHNQQTSSSVCATCKAPLSLSCSKCLVSPILTYDQPLQMQSCLAEKQTVKFKESLHLKNQPALLAAENGEAYNEQDQPVSLVMNRDVEYGQDSMDLPVHFEDISSNSAEEILDQFRQKDHATSECAKKLYSCSMCNSVFTQLGSLKRHKRIHTGERPFVCKLCGGKFIEQGTLNKHMQTHSHQKPFMCQICGVSFTQSGSLKRHMRLHTGEKPYVCTECRATFVEKGSLNKHMRTHSSEKPYLCQECGAAFTQSGSMKRHMMIHTGIKPYMCTDCGAAFLEKATLKIHMRRHTGEKPYMCHECGAAFSQRSNLKFHKRRHVTGDSELVETSGEWHSETDENSTLVMNGLSIQNSEQDTDGVDTV